VVRDEVRKSPTHFVSQACSLETRWELVNDATFKRPKVFFCSPCSCKYQRSSCLPVSWTLWHRIFDGLRSGVRRRQKNTPPTYPFVMFLTHGLFSLFLRSHRCFQGVVQIRFKPSLKDLLTKSKFLCYAEDWPTLLVRLEASRLEHPCAKMTWWTLPLDSLPKPKVRECSWMGLVVGPKTSALFNEGLAQFRNPYYCFKAMQHVPHLAPSSQLNVPDERWMNFYDIRWPWNGPVPTRSTLLHVDVRSIWMQGYHFLWNGASPPDCLQKVRL
jgi:hypothetical protein